MHTTVDTIVLLRCLRLGSEYNVAGVKPSATVDEMVQFEILAPRIQEVFFVHYPFEAVMVREPELGLRASGRLCYRADVSVQESPVVNAIFFTGRVENRV